MQWKGLAWKGHYADNQLNVEKFSGNTPNVKTLSLIDIVNNAR